MTELERLDMRERARLAAMADAGTIGDHILSLTSHVPLDGDVAHRQGIAKSKNPFPADDHRRAIWNDDWEFRHRHALPSAADAPGGRLRPAR